MKNIIYKREFYLKKIRDNHPKYVLSMDTIPPTNEEGIKRVNIIDFLLKDDFEK